MPQALREKLAGAAAEAGRSFNSEVLHRLTLSFESEGRPASLVTHLRPRSAIRLAALTAVALGALTAVLVVAFATGSKGRVSPVSKFATADRDAAAVLRFGNDDEPHGADDYRLSVRAYPAADVARRWSQAARDSFSALAARRPTAAAPRWRRYGPAVTATAPGILTFSGAPYAAAGRTLSLAISPGCRAGSCPMWAGFAGGGIWRTDDPARPGWTRLAGPLAEKTVGTIVLDPGDPRGRTLVVGTGEPNACGSACEAGGELYRSVDGGSSWTKLPGSSTFAGRAISAIALDPGDPRHMYVGSASPARPIPHALGRGGDVRFAETGAKAPGLYESFDGGATFAPAWIPAAGSSGSEPVGVTDIALDPLDPRTVYASAFDEGLWRRCPTTVSASCGGEVASSRVEFRQVFAPRAPGTGLERTMFDLTVSRGKTRIYLTTGQVGKSPGCRRLARHRVCESAASFWRTDDANQSSSVLLTSEPAVPAVPPTGRERLFPARFDGWQILSSPSVASPYWATDGFCSEQCWFDEDVYTPKHPALPDTVYVIGSFRYDEVPCDTKGVGCGSGISNGRSVLYSTTAGDPDPAAGLRTFTDMTYEAGAAAPRSVHPDQHAIVVDPSRPTRFYVGSDGGISRSSGSFTDASRSCSARRIRDGDGLTQCRRLLSRISSRLDSANRGLASTLRFAGIAADPLQPCRVVGGTEDNGTWDSTGDCRGGAWRQKLYGDGGNAGFDRYPDQSPSATGVSWMFAQFRLGLTDSNFRGGAPENWVVTSGRQIGPAPRGLPVENVALYPPQIPDPNAPLYRGKRTHPIFAGMQHVWRTWAWGAGRSVTVPQQVVPDISFYETRCSEFTAFGGDDACGDYQPLGGRAGADRPGDLTGRFYGGDRTGGAVSALARRAADTDTMWAATSAGRVFVTWTANAVDPAKVVWYRVDALRTLGGNPCGPAGAPAPNCSPTRYPTAIYPDRRNANVAYVAYSGYSAATPATSGHVFRVTLTRGGAAPSGVTFARLDSDDLPVNDLAVDDSTGDLYAATDFGVLRGHRGGSGTVRWSATRGLPEAEVSRLAMVPGQRDACRAACPRRLYGVTHAEGIWVLPLG